MRRYIILIMVLSILVSGCEYQPDEPVEKTIQFDWMAGESPIPQQRSQIKRQGILYGTFESAEDGVYFLYQCMTGNGETYVLYGDHDSDTIIKLCGRADCLHNTEDCNAYLDGGTQISSYDGKLYVVNGNAAIPEVLCMDLDGSNRMIAVDMKSFASENGFSSATWPVISNGIFMVGLGNLNAAGIPETWSYYYRLDDSMAEPERQNGYLYVGSIGEMGLQYYPTSSDGGSAGSYYLWNPDTNEAAFLTDSFGTGYYGKTEAWYYRDGSVYRRDYASGIEEVLFFTDLKGSYTAFFYPDCIVIGSDDYAGNSDRNLYIYNWAFELVDTVELDYSSRAAPRECILGETAHRIILTDMFLGLPRYYIEKSELGTGNVKIHEYNLPDLTEELAMIDEQLSGD